MDRTDWNDAIQGMVNTERNRVVGLADGGDNDDLDPLDRPNRRDGNGDLVIVAGSNIKENDDLHLITGTTVRVICGGLMRDQIMTWGLDPTGIQLAQYPVSFVDDRAAADPGDTDPVWPPTP